MRWEQLHIVEIVLPFRVPFEMATAKVKDRRVTLVGVEADGFVGWGEAAPWPGVTVEDSDDVWSGLTEFEAGDESELPATALAALEEAIIDQRARALGHPLAEMLGGTRDKIPAAPAIGIYRDLGLLEGAVAEAVEAGYGGVKLKIKPGWDTEPVAAIRSLFPDLRMGVDANGSYTDPSDPTFDVLDSLKLEYLEQPMGKFDLSGSAELRSRLSTPICLDESVESVPAAEMAIEGEAADILTLKAGRLGLQNSLRVHDLAVEAGLELKAAGLLDSGVGRGHMLALASQPGVRYFDLATTDWYFTQDVVAPKWQLKDGAITAPSAPGIGVDVDWPLLDAVTVRSVSR
jgi:O-succinylbenzoate synthase